LTCCAHLRMIRAKTSAPTFIMSHRAATDKTLLSCVDVTLHAGKHIICGGVGQ
jgi:hypothetical protein